MKIHTMWLRHTLIFVPVCQTETIRLIKLAISLIEQAEPNPDEWSATVAAADLLASKLSRLYAYADKPEYAVASAALNATTTTMGEHKKNVAPSFEWSAAYASAWSNPKTSSEQLAHVKVTEETLLKIWKQYY
jgi:hypothetical protein